MTGQPFRQITPDRCYGAISKQHQGGTSNDDENAHEILKCESEPIVNESDSQEFIVYARRWIVLASFCMLTWTSAWIWITFSPIAYPVSQLWNVGIEDVDALAGIYLYVYVPGSFVALYLVVNHLGLQRGLILGGTLNAMGAIIRYQGLYRYSNVYVGTLLAAMAQTFTLSTPPLIAGSWFGASERSTATAIGVLANQLGSATGLGVTILVDFSSQNEKSPIDTDRLKQYLGFQVIAAVAALVLVVIFGGDHPPTPPSMATQLARYNGADVHPNGGKECGELDSNAVENKSLIRDSEKLMSDGEEYKNDYVAFEEPMGLSYFDSIRLVFSRLAYISFLLSFGLGVGVYYTIPVFLTQLLPPSWTPSAAGWMGVTYIVMGGLGSFCCGKIVDLTQRHRLVCLAVLAGGVVSLIVFAIYQYTMNSVSSLSGGYGDDDDGYAEIVSNALMIVGISCTGLCLAAWNTLGFEFGTALTYPADEAAVAGVLECSAELFAFLFVTVGGYLIARGKCAAFVALMGSLVFLAFCLLFNNRAESKRPNH